MTVRDKSVPMTRKEFDLLAFLAASPGQVFSREDLLERVWGSTEEWQGRSTVTEHVRRVRLKIEPDPDSPRWITTVRGVGYRFTLPATPERHGRRRGRRRRTRCIALALRTPNFLVQKSYAAGRGHLPTLRTQLGTRSL